MFQTSLIELVSGAALLFAGFLIARTLYYAFRRQVLPRVLRIDVVSDLIVVGDLGVMMLGVAFIFDSAFKVWPLLAGTAH